MRHDPAMVSPTGRRQRRGGKRLLRDISIAFDRFRIWYILRLVEWDPVKVAAWLRDHIDSCTPPGHAAVALAGRVDFGTTWYASLIDDLMG